MTKKAKSSKKPVTEHRPFRFQSLHERLNKINIDVVHRIRYHERTDLNDIESLTRSSHFHQALQHWSTLNFSEAFSELHRILLPLAGSLEQVVFNRDRIIEEVRRSLSERNPLIIATLLDLIAQLARDLQGDFYVYYKEFLFVEIVDLLIHRKEKKIQQNEIDTQLLEDVFQCLTYLFKYLWRIMLKDLANLYELYSKYLFSSTMTNTSTANYEYIRSFAAESFAYLLRKIENYRPFIDFLFDWKIRDENEIESLALVFAETCKNVQSTLHSCTKPLLECLLKKLIVKIDPLATCLKEIYSLLIEHVENLENFSILFVSLLETYRTIDVEQLTWPILQTFYEIFHLFIDQRQNFVVENEKVFEFLCRVEKSCDEQFFRLHFETLAKIFENISINEQFVDLYFRFADETPSNLFFDETKRIFRSKFSSKLPNGFFRRFWKILIEKSTNSSNLIEFFVETILIEREKAEMNFSLNDQNEKVEEKLEKFSSRKHFLSKDKIGEKGVETIFEFINDVLSKIDDENLLNNGQIWRSTLLLNSLSSNDVKSIENLSKINEFSPKSSNRPIVASTLIELTIFGRRFPTSFWFSILENSSKCKFLLFATRLAFFIASPEKTFGSKFVELLKTNFSAFKSTIRFLTLEILVEFDNDEIDDVIRICASCERCPLNVYEYREKILFLQKLSVDFLLLKSNPSNSFRLALLYLFGVLKSNFTPLRNVVIDLIGSYGKKALEKIGHAEFWTIFDDEFRFVRNRDETFLKNDDDESFPYKNDRNDEINEKNFDWNEFRSNLFEILQHFPSECENKTKLIFPEIFRFFTEEFYDQRLFSNGKSSRRLSEKISLKTGEKMLKLLKEFRHWRQWTDVERLYEFYVRLLLSSNCEIQQLAFQCLLTCVSMPNSTLQKEFLPHVEKILPVFQPNSCRKTLHELIHGVLLDPNQNESLKNQLAFVLIRILFSKLNSKRQLGSTTRRRKNFAELNQKFLFQFLLTFASNRIYSEHFRFFLRLLLEPFAGQIFDGLTSNFVEENVENFLKILRHSFSLIKTFVDKLGVYFHDYVEYFLRFDILTIEFVDKIVDFRLLTRKIRSAAFKNLRRIFEIFDDAEKNPFEKNFFDEIWRIAVKESFLDETKGRREDVVHLLKLSVVWSRTTFLRHFVFDDRPEAKKLVEFFFKILNENRRDENETLVFEFISNLMRRDPNDSLLIDHHEEILDYLTKISSTGSILSDDQFEILFFLTEKTSSNKLAEIFLRSIRQNLLAKTSRKTFNISSCFRVLQNLFVQIDEPEDKCRRFLSIFSRKLRERTQRDQFVKFCQIVVDRSSNELLKVFVDLNSWNSEQIGEPNYEIRLKTYRNILSTDFDVERTEIDLLFSHFLYELETSINDLSLRENASLCLEKFVRKMPKFRKILFDEIRSNLQNSRSQTAVRHEFLRLLSILVDLDESNEEIFLDLKRLRNSTDIEIDFFQNISHVQQHRRLRALKRLNKFDEQMPFHLSTIENILLPIVSTFVDEVLNGQNDDLQDEIVFQCLTNFSRKLFWPKFRRVFITFFRQLTNRKTLNLTQKRVLTRTISSIIDAFHFQNDSNVEQIRQTIEKRFLPMIFQLLTENSFNVDKSTNDDERQQAVLLTTTCSLISSKILVTFDSNFVEKHISTIVLHLINLLRSRIYSIRDQTRETLCKILIIFGDRYLKFFVEELIGGLKRGFQHFVLLHTLNALLIHIDSSAVDFRIDSAVKILVDLFVNDLFNKEKTESSKAAEHDNSSYKPSNVPEAKTNKTANVFELIGRLIRSSDEIFIAIEPLRRQLIENNESKWISQCEKCLQRFQTGLISNLRLTMKNFFVFLHHLLRKTDDNESTTVKTDDKEQNRYHLVPQEPRRLAVRPIPMNKKTNSHCLVSWALNFLQKLIKKYKNSDENFLSMIDPFVEHVEKCLNSPYVDVVVGSMRNLSSLLEFSLPSLNKSRVTKFYKKIFDLLKIYSSIGVSTDQNDLLTLGYKILGLFVQRSTSDDVRLSSDEIFCLFNYVESDLLDVHRRSSAFLLLRSVIRHYVSIISQEKTLRSKLDEIVRSRLQNLIVQSPFDHIRSFARELVQIYLFSYEHSKSKLKGFFDFFLLQLDYEENAGRASVLMFFKVLFEDLPKNRLNENAAFFFVPFSSQFYNETNVECKKLFQEDLRLLIGKIDDEQRNDLLKNIVCVWLNDQISHRCLASQLILFFIEIQREHFDEFLPEILRFVLKEIEEMSTEENEDEQTQKFTDQFFFHLINVLLHLTKFCPNGVSAVSLRSIWLKLTKLIDEKGLLHPHVWIRAASAEFFGRIFDFQTPIEFIRSIEKFFNENVETKAKRSKKFDLNNENLFVHFIGETNSLIKIQRLCLCVCSQLKPSGLTDEFSLQVTKNLIYLSKILILSESKHLDLVVRRTSRLTTFESTKHPNETTRRSAVLKWIAALIVEHSTMLETHYNAFLTIIEREIERDETTTLKNLAQDVFDVFKRHADIHLVTKIYAEIATQRRTKRAERKQKLAVLAINQPDIVYRKKRVKQTKRAGLSKKKRLKAIEKAKKDRRKKSVTTRSQDFDDDF